LPLQYEERRQRECRCNRAITRFDAGPDDDPAPESPRTVQRDWSFTQFDPCGKLVLWIAKAKWAQEFASANLIFRKLMLVTVIIPAFNAEKTLRACLESVISQTMLDREIIVIDGGSRDQTIQIIRDFSQNLASWSSEPDRGIYDAANKGIQRARGDWIYFLGADDVLSDNTVLERIEPFLRGALPDYRVVYGRVDMLGANGDVLKVLGSPWQDSRKSFVSYMSIPHQGIFSHKSLFQEHGGFDLTYRTGGDYEFLLRELVHRDAVFADNLVVATCRTGGQSGRAADYVELLLEWRRAQRQHGYRWPSVRWIVGLLGAYLHKVLYLVFGEKTGARLFDLARGVFGKPPYWSRIK
jgi:glycosyltransferase involved in cell wall biosynthesis